MYALNIISLFHKLKRSILVFFIFFTPCCHVVFAKCHITTSVPGKWERIQSEEECKLAKKILKWKSLEEDDPSFEDIVHFFENSPTWPNQVALKRKAELSIDKDTDKDLMREWFRKNPPATHKGALEFLKVAQKQDQKTIENIFIKVPLTQSDLKAFLSYGKKYIDKGEILQRFNYLMYEDRLDEAEMLIPHLEKNKIHIAKDRISLAKGQHRKRLTTHDEGYLWQYGRYLLKGEKNDDLKRFLEEKSVQKAIEQEPDRWWNSIQKILARRYLEKKRYKDCYGVVKGAKTERGAPFAESKWLEGWLNLKFLNNSKKAYTDFQELYEKMETAISLSKAAYWAGRAAEAHKNKHKRDEWLKKAAKNRGVFYGQLASSMLEEDFDPKDYVVSKQERKDFDNLELVRVIRLLKKIGNIELSELFFWKLAIQVDKPDEHELLISLAAEVAGPHAAVQVTKIGAKYVMPVMEEAYPKLDRMLMPPLFDDAHINMQALIHAIIRKESRFKSKAVSPKGAKGLMQILDGTARQIARADKSLKYGSLFDPKSNVALGEAYLRGLLKRYNGSLILTIAAYNAGPNRVDKWIKEFGYPGKSGKIEAVEWIQLIPYWETRDYVERVLENYWRYTISFLGVPIKNWHKKLF